MNITFNMPPIILFTHNRPLLCFYYKPQTVSCQKFLKPIACAFLLLLFSCRQELNITNDKNPPELYFSSNWKINSLYINDLHLVNLLCSSSLIEIFVSDSSGVSKWTYNYDGNLLKNPEKIFNKAGFNSPVMFKNKLWGIVSCESFKYGGQINYYTYDGESFSGPYQIRDVGWGEFQPPIINSDLNNNLYCVWTDSRNGNRDVYFSASSDKGKAWSDNIKINTDNSGQEQTAGNIICTGTGNLIVVWNDNRNSRTLFDLYSSTSTDKGKTWNENVKINDDTTHAWQMISFAEKSKDDNIYIVWTDYRNTNKNGDHFSAIYFSRSIDYGKSWMHNIPIQIPSKGNSAYPVLFVSPDENLNCAWLSSEDNQMNDVIFSYSTNRGQNWSKATRVNDDVERTKHKIAFIFHREKNDVIVGTFDWRESEQNIYLAKSSLIEDATRKKREYKVAADTGKKYTKYIFYKGKELFEDKFKNGKQTGWTNINGYWIVHENSLIGYGVNEARSFAGSPNWKNYIFDGQFKLDATDHRAAYIYFRVNNENNLLTYYRIKNYFKSGVVVEYFDGRVLLPVIESPFSIQKDKWYDFRVEVKDNFLNYFLNDNLLLFTDKINLIPRGKIGVGAFYSPAYFRNISVSEIK